jgi:uncharacterized protein YbjT (DUF2867 family)
MTVAVTGALGFVASHLLPRLIARGDGVRAVVRPGRDAAALERIGCEVRRADLQDPARYPEAFDGADAVVHLAGLALAPALVPVLERAGVARAVCVGSAGVYTRLASRGAEAKRRGEAALAASSLAWTVLRPSMIYGTPADRNLVRLLRWIRRWHVVAVPGGGRTPQQPVHVEDLCDAIVASLDRPASAGRAYDVGGPEALPLSEVIALAARALGTRAWVVPVPLAPAHALIVGLRALRLPTPVTPEQILRLAESKAVDIGPARRDLGFAPRPFAAGIAEEARLLSAAGG